MPPLVISCGVLLMQPADDRVKEGSACDEEVGLNALLESTVVLPAKTWTGRVAL